MAFERDSAGGVTDVEQCFVDEAGCPTLFSLKGKILVGTEGCSSFFIMGKAVISDPVVVAKELGSLRKDLLNDPYFKRVPSMQPAAKKTARAFHAKDDPAEVRREVFKVLLKHDVHFYAVVRDKLDLLAYVKQSNETGSRYRYKPNELYDVLVRELFCKLHGWMPDQLQITFSRRGNKDRNEALRLALEEAEKKFLEEFGFNRPTKLVIQAKSPHEVSGLQVVDYYLWALQRFYEKREERYLELVWPHVKEVNDLDYVEGGKRGVLFSGERVLTLDTRKIP